MHFIHNESVQDFTEYVKWLASMVMASVALLFTSASAMTSNGVTTDSRLNTANRLATS